MYNIVIVCLPLCEYLKYRNLFPSEIGTCSSPMGAVPVFVSMVTFNPYGVLVSLGSRCSR